MAVSVGAAGNQSWAYTSDEGILSLKRFGGGGRRIFRLGASFASCVIFKV